MTIRTSTSLSGTGLVWADDNTPEERAYLERFMRLASELNISNNPELLKYLIKLEDRITALEAGQTNASMKDGNSEIPPTDSLSANRGRL